MYSSKNRSISEVYVHVQCSVDCIIDQLITVHVAGNFRGQADLHEIIPHENVGVAYRNACNAVQAVKETKFILTKITVFQFNEFFTPRKLPALRYHKV